MAKKVSNDGKEFERDVAKVYEVLTRLAGNTVVKQDQMVSGPDGARQLDVVLETRIAGEKLLTVIECKDTKRRADINVVGELHSKLTDVMGHKGIIVSRNGFTGGAKRKAMRLGISLCTVDRLTDKMDSPLASFPIVFKSLSADTFRMSVVPKQGQFSGGVRIDANHLVSGKGLMEIVAFTPIDSVKAGDDHKITLTEKLLGEPLWLPTPDGGRAELEECEIYFSTAKEIFFGYASDLPSSLIKKNIRGSNHDILIDAEDFKEVSNHFVRYESFSALPDHAKRVFILATSVPSRVESIGEVSLYGVNRESGERTGRIMPDV